VQPRKSPAIDRLASLETRLAGLMLMVGGLFALGAPAIWLLIRIGAKVGAFS
jgi:hypothetical protein